MLAATWMIVPLFFYGPKGPRAMSHAARILFHGEYRARSAAFTGGLVIAIFATLLIVACAAYLRHDAETNPRADRGTADLLRVVSVVAVCGTLIGVVKWLEREHWTLRVTDGTIAWSGKSGLIEVDAKHVATMAFRADDGGAGLAVVMDDGAMYSVPPPCLMTDVGRFCEVVHAQFPQIELTYNDRPTCGRCGRPVRVPVRRRLAPEELERFCQCPQPGAS
jgi:hypothetical protein